MPAIITSGWMNGYVDAMQDSAPVNAFEAFEKDDASYFAGSASLYVFTIFC